MTHEYNGIADDTCPMGCIFYKGKLEGDCRAPYRADCALKLAANLKRITEFCTYCGAGIGVHRREGEGTCPRCHHKGKDWTPVTELIPDTDV